jgi:hypothetical protein
MRGPISLERRNWRVLLILAGVTAVLYGLAIAGVLVLN